MTAASATTLARARAGDQGAFSDLVNPYRRQLLVHCYRILGSVQDAEDVLQEVLLSAWRALGQFDGGSFRAWLYRIATNRCLNYFRDDARRPTRVSGRRTQPTRSDEPWWLEPFPDALLDEAEPGRGPVRIPRVDRTLVRCRPSAAAGTAACRARLARCPRVLGLGNSRHPRVHSGVGEQRAAKSENRLSAVASCRPRTSAAVPGRSTGGHSFRRGLRNR